MQSNSKVSTPHQVVSGIDACVIFKCGDTSITFVSANSLFFIVERAHWSMSLGRKEFKVDEKRQM